MNELPQGLTLEPPIQPPQLAPPPPGLELVNEPTAVPPLPPGLSFVDPLNPDKSVPPQKTNIEVPGFWDAAGSAFMRGMTQRAANDVAGLQVILPKDLGGKTLEEQNQEGLLHPEAKDTIDNLLQQKVNEGWSDPKWWASHIAHGAGGMVPGLGAAAGGAALGSAPGAIGGFTLEAGLGSIVPAYKAARAAGLDPEAATVRALVDSGIASGTAVAMGLAPEAAIFGKVQNPAVTDQVAIMLRRPVMEMLAQLGVVQPSLAVTGELTTALTHGEKPDPWDLGTTFAEGVGMGGAFVGAHAVTRGARSAARAAIPAEAPASQATIDEAFRSQQPPLPQGLEVASGTVPPDIPPGGGKPSVIRPSEPPAIPIDIPDEQLRQMFDQKRAEQVAPDLAEEQLYPRPLASTESRIFFSSVRQAIEQRLPETASVEQTLATIRNAPGVKEEELRDLQLPRYLEGLDGKVNKKDLLAHLEANSVVLEEAMAGDSPLLQHAKVLAVAENGPGSWDRIGGGGQQHYLDEARREIQRQYVQILHPLEEQYGYNHDAWPQEARDRLATVRHEVEQMVSPTRIPSFPGVVSPGEHSNYREFILKVPAQEADPVAVHELAKREYESQHSAAGFKFEEAGSGSKKWFLQQARDMLRPPVYVNEAHWPHDLNPIVHFRVTDRQGPNGHTYLHVEEVQSDLHQLGRRQKYLDPNAPKMSDIQPKIRLLEDTELRPLIEHYRTRGGQYAMMDDPKFQEINARRNALYREFRIAQENEMALPDLPFKTSWHELAVKRILRLAADEGYDRVSWTNGDQVGLRVATPEQIQGNREFYDKKLSQAFNKWADKLGMDKGETHLIDGALQRKLAEAPTAQRALALHQLYREAGFMKNFNDRNRYVEVNPAAGSRIRQGLPLYEEDARPNRTLSENLKRGLPKELAEPGKKLVQALGELGRKIKLSRGMQIVVGPDRKNRRGWVEGRLNSKGEYIVHVNTRLLSTPQDVWATMGHELGHVIYEDKWASAPMKVKLAVDAAFRAFRQQMNETARTVGDVRRLRDNAVSEMTGARDQDNSLPLSDLAPRSRAYILHYKEWYAEQVAKWATTSEKPLGIVERFMKDVGTTIRDLIQKFEQIRGRSPKAEQMLQEWLDGLDMDATRFADVKDQMEFETKRQNAAAQDRDGTPHAPASPITASTMGGRNIIDNLPPGASGTSGPASAAHADRMNKFWEWMTSLPQIAEANKHIRPLTMYKEIVATMNIEKNNIMGAAWETLRQWKGIRDPKQQFALTKFIDDYANGLFKDPRDMSGTVRRPTAAEFSALARKHGLSDQSVRMFKKLQVDFDNFLEGYRQLLLDDASRIKDPDKQKQAVDDVNKKVDALLNRPFFPITRFGKYTVTVYDTAGNVRHSEHTDSLRKQKQIKMALEKSPDLLPGDRVRTGEVPKDSAPLLGMPPGLLDLMADKLDLSPTQRGILDQLRFDYAPSQSFRHQFKTKDLTPGYSTDFQRAYAHFFFHGANHMTRVKWVDALRDQVREVKQGSIDLNDAVKRDQIANYLTTHLDMLVDPKPDFAALRGLMFHWYLGFNPASATLNLSQTPIMTYPFLASKFGGIGIGDIRSVLSLAKASKELNTFYKKGSLVEAGKANKNTPGFEGAKARALGEAVNEGVLSETQAHTLAAVSENRNLLRAFGSKGEEFWQKFSEASSWMFEMTEQYNRRVAFRAAWELAYRDPNNKYVQETIRDNPLQYQRLKEQNWTHQEAAAFVAAKDATEKTQFVYAPYARPKFMWGRKGALFIFKSFVQNTLFNLWNNKAAGARSLLILGAVGGMMGLPGMEDINGILKSLAWRLFGKDFDLEDEARKFSVDVLNGTIGPDMLLHGTSTKGFGIPHVMNGMGSMVGLPKWFPTLDRHGSIGMGNVLPFEPGKLFGPAKDAKTNELAQLQRASGAGFSNIFALYNFLTSTQSIGDMKRWEQIMPRAMSNVSHAARYFVEGAERNKAGNSVVRFDPNDTEQMAEILARAAGYQPRRLIAQYEQIQAQQEAATYWDLRKQILLRQFGTALKGNSSEEKASVLQSIRNYNQELPQEAKAKAITSTALRDSVRSRLQNAAKQEAGLPTNKQNYQLFKSMEKYFPEGRPVGQTDARTVK